MAPAGQTISFGLKWIFSADNDHSRYSQWNIHESLASSKSFECGS